MKSKNLCSYLLIISMITIYACKKDNADMLPVPMLAARTITDLSYGSHAQQKLDVYLPPNRDKNTPVALLLHGGGFILGDKNDISETAKKFSAKGYAVVNLNYRLVDTSGLFSTPLVHRASSVTIADQLKDVESAIQYAISKSDEWVMSKTKLGLSGHSAGATLALLYAYGDKNENDLIKAVGNWAGATTLAFNDESEFDSVDPRLKEVYFRAVGVEVKNVNKLAFMGVSPYWVLFNANTVPATINIRPENNVVGGLPDASPMLFQEFTDLLNEKAVANRYVVVAGADHGFSQAGTWDVVVNETAAFFELYAK